MWRCYMYGKSPKDDICTFYVFGMTQQRKCFDDKRVYLFAWMRERESRSVYLFSCGHAYLRKFVCMCVCFVCVFSVWVFFVYVMCFGVREHVFNFVSKTNKSGGRDMHSFQFFISGCWNIGACHALRWFHLVVTHCHWSPFRITARQSDTRK